MVKKELYLLEKQMILKRTKRMEKLDELQLDKYKNVKAERLDSKYQARHVLWRCERNSVYGLLPWNCFLSNDGKLSHV